MSSSKSSDEKFQEAFDFLQLGNLNNAEKIYLDLIDNGIENNVIFANLGAISLLRKNWENSILYLKKALFIKKDDANSLNNLAIAYKELKDYPQALEYANKSIKIQDSNPNFHQTLALIYLDCGDVFNSINSLNKVINLEPISPRAFSLLGKAYKIQKNYYLANKNYQKALFIKPNHIDSLIGLGSISIDQYKFQKAIEYFEDVINIQKHNFHALHGLAITYGSIGDHEKAKLFFNKVLSINPDFEEALINIAHIEFRNKNYIEAISFYKRAMNINPLNKELIIYILNCKASICDWSEYKENISLLKSMDAFNQDISPMLFMPFEDNPAYILTRARNFYLKNFKRESQKILKIKKSKIRIAYFSANFNDHPVTLLMKYILKLHDRDKFEVFAYSYSAFEDDKYTKEIRCNVDQFIDIYSLDEIQIVNKVREDSIDIAIDLMGYTADTRFSIFSYRVAPIQISYLGYPGTTGSSSIDYLIADRFLIPESYKKFYSEKIIYLSNCYLAHDDRLIPNIKEKKEIYDLPKDQLIFTTFNTNYKINKNIFDIWMDLLLSFDKSVLWLYASNQLTKNNLLLYAKNKGVNPKRLIFAYKVPIETHINRLLQGHIFLDTCYYSSGATAWFALAAGLPIVTLCGRSYTSRMSSSLLNALGLTELITYNFDDYKQLALKLAKDKDYLNYIKNKLKVAIKNSSLFNSKLFAKELDDLYRKLYVENFNN